MKIDNDNKQNYLKAKKKVRHIQFFYIHLVIYVIIVPFILNTIYTVDIGEFSKTIIAVDVFSLVAWTIFIILHGWRVFKGRIFFKKSWEDKKIKEFLEKENTDKMYE